MTTVPRMRQVRPLGLRRPDKTRPVIRLPLTGLVPDHPQSVDHLSRVPLWNGNTNFTYGTCGPVSVANGAIDTWQYLLGERLIVADSAIFDLYRRSGNPDFDPDTGAGDDGVDMTVMLAELVRGGLVLSSGAVERLEKPLCFAQVTFPPYDDLHAATSIFGQVILALDLDAAQQDQPVWDYVPGSSPWGGHAVMGGAYTSAPYTTPDISVITWEQVQGTTAPFIDHQMYAAYVIVWAPLWDHPAFAEGVDRARLAEDFTAVTGRPFPLPVPPPSPGPVPVGPTDLDNRTLAVTGDPWAARRHCGGNATMARAYKTWRATWQ